MLDKKIKLKEIRELGALNYLLTLASPEQARLVRPGQFVMVKCTDEVDDNPLLRRPFSVFDARKRAGREGAAGIDILVKNVGAGTRRLAELGVGDEVYVLGPQGRPFDIDRAVSGGTRTACLVAGGVGIAAFLLLARALKQRRIAPILFYGGRSRADLVLRDEFEALGIETHYTTEDGSAGARGLVTSAVETYLRGRDPAGCRIYACGPWGMMKAAHEVALRAGVPCEVSLEARMGCSLGACMGCVIRGWDESGEEQFLRVCLEGPVMASTTVDWDTPPM